MVAVIVLILSILSVYSQTYYVSTSGSDSSSCGSQSSPCAGINQVITNYPGSSYTISIASGVYNTTPITLQKDAVVVLQGTGNPTIVTSSWRSGAFVSNTQTSGLEFHDLTLNLTGSGTSFTTLNAGANSFGLYNVVLSLSGYSSGDVVDINGGSVTVNNVTLTGASFDAYFIFADSDGEDTNITVTGSTFTNLNIGEYGAFLVFDAYGSANIIINSTTFNNISSDYVFIGFWAEDSNQVVSVTNSVFNNTYTYLPSIYVENDYQCVIYVNNTTWNNATADFVCGALETLGSDDGQDHNITLNNLKFSNCNGPYAGALLVAFNSLNLSGSSFSGDYADYGNDVVQGLDSYTAQFKYNITNSYSSSALPKAVVWNLSSGTVTDISDQLPNPSSVSMHAGPLSRGKLSASPKGGRKQRKN